MSFSLDDTMAAPASAPGPAGRGIIRVSGPRALECVDRFFEPVDSTDEFHGPLRTLRRASVCRGALRLPGLRRPLAVLVFAWPGPRSYTGQPLVEIHAPGSPPLLEAILGELFESGVRPAGPGEFTLRAFLSGRIDLVQAEAVLATIDAADAAHLETALRQMAGGLSGRLGRLRALLLNLLAELEAGLDFVDEDIEFVSQDEACRRLSEAQRQVDALIEQCGTRGQSTGRRRVVLAGLPNAGKSTLFNSLLNRPAALTSHQPGTTRDYLCGEVIWRGLAVELIDTPGCDALEPDREEAAIMDAALRLARAQRERADLVVWCTPADLAGDRRAVEAPLVESLLAANRPCVFVTTKADLLADRPGSCGEAAPPLAVSAATGRGLDALENECVDRLSGPLCGSSELVGATQARCRESLFHAGQSLARAGEAVRVRAGDELVALEIREALDHLGRILGAVYTDDILDRIFSRFCIGK